METKYRPNAKMEEDMVDREEILKIAKLARLRVKEDEIEQLSKDMSEIIDFADTINMAVDNEVIEFEDINNIVNVFNDDQVKESFLQEEILKNRDGGENGYFVIKKELNRW